MQCGVSSAPLKLLLVSKSKVLPIPCKLEILRFLCLVPVARMDFRLSLDHRVSCSDASEHGGGLCSSVGLSGLGQLASAGALRGHPGVFRDSDPVLCVGHLRWYWGP